VAEYSDKKILDSWFKNAKPWISAIRDNEIESRTLITNSAIINTILQHDPKNVLDIGCGEGWLARELNTHNIRTIGIDAIPELIDAAKEKGGGRFRLLAYDDLTLDVINEKFDLIICNFSLLGNESVTHLFQHVPTMLNDGGYFIVQTIHPIHGCQENKYNDGWREGSWLGFNQQFTDPAPWYFRTLKSWKTLFSLNNLTLKEIIEPLSPKTGNPASIIFIGKTIYSTS